MPSTSWPALLAAASFVAACTVSPLANAADDAATTLGLIPKPVSVEGLPGTFRLTRECRVSYPRGSGDAEEKARVLSKVLRDSTGLALPVEGVSTPPKEGAIFLTTGHAQPSLPSEGYRLEVAPKLIVLQGGTGAGLFYGIQTLRQLLPAETFGPRAPAGTTTYTIPCLRIADEPRFPWRGMHLDVSRHFFDTDFIKRYLDNLAMHKLNVFHWHLTDDDGWRVEIKKYPRLTQVGAWRGPTEALPPSYESGSARYGGFYTQKQVGEIVRYAAERHILIVPEVDVPAHCRAATVAYPELLCAGDPYRFKSVQDVPANVLCPSQEKTYEFLAGVFGELAELFPGPYLHAGGDERPVGPWEQCERCQRRMKEEHLSDGKVLQDRFLKRLQDICRSHGKRMIGWDELEHETVLATDYTVMAWNSVPAGIAAAKKGYPVIMAPSPFTYFDLSYNVDPLEPGQRWAGLISVEKVYSFDPKPADLPAEVAQRIGGVHGCLWSETLITPERPDYMAYPRLCALAEVAWTPQNQRAWPDFWSRLTMQHLARLDAAYIFYRIPLPLEQRSGNTVTIVPPYANAEVHYALDDADPSPDSPVFQRPFELPQGGGLKMRTFRPNGRGSRTVSGEQSLKFGP